MRSLAANEAWKAPSLRRDTWKVLGCDLDCPPLRFSSSSSVLDRLKYEEKDGGGRWRNQKTGKGRSSVGGWMEEDGVDGGDGEGMAREMCLPFQDPMIDGEYK